MFPQMYREYRLYFDFSWEIMVLKRAPAGSVKEGVSVCFSPTSVAWKSAEKFLLHSEYS